MKFLIYINFLTQGETSLIELDTNNTPSIIIISQPSIQDFYLCIYIYIKCNALSHKRNYVYKNTLRKNMFSSAQSIMNH